MNDGSRLVQALRREFAPPRYVTALEVRNTTGLYARRAADVVAMSLWPSQGLHLHGIEIKQSASDLRKELNDPRKAETIAEYCDYWWLATTAEVAQTKAFDDVPQTWGLFVLTGDKLKKFRKPTAHTPRALDRGFVAALLRGNLEASSGYVARCEIAAELVKEYERGKADVERRRAHTLAAAQQRLEQLEAVLQRFRKLTGVNLHEGCDGYLAERFWERLGAAAALLKTGGLNTARRQLLRDADAAEQAAAALRRCVAESEQYLAELADGN